MNEIFVKKKRMKIKFLKLVMGETKFPNIFVAEYLLEYSYLNKSNNNHKHNTISYF